MKTNSILLNCFPSFNASKYIKAIIKSLVCASFSFWIIHGTFQLQFSFFTTQHAFALLSTTPPNLHSVISAKRGTLIYKPKESQMRKAEPLRWWKTKPFFFFLHKVNGSKPFGGLKSVYILYWPKQANNKDRNHRGRRQILTKAFLVSFVFHQSQCQWTSTHAPSKRG